MLEILTHECVGQRMTQENWAEMVDLLCDIAEGKTTSFGHDSCQIVRQMKTKYHFNDFLFEKYSHQCQAEFLMFDFVLFFESNKHSDMILDPISNYSLKKMENLLYKIENHRKEILGDNQKYFKSFNAHLIDKCLHFIQEYAYKTDIFQRMFGVLISFIKKYDCMVGSKAPMFINKIYECIVANHYHGNLDKKTTEKYYQDYVAFIEHQSHREQHQSPVKIDSEYTNKINRLCHQTVIQQFSNLCQIAISHAEKWKNSTHDRDRVCNFSFGIEYSEKRFLNQTRSWIEKVCDFYAYYWKLYEKQFPHHHSAAFVKAKNDLIFNYKFFRTLFQIVFFDIKFDYVNHMHGDDPDHMHCKHSLKNNINQNEKNNNKTKHQKDFKTKLWWQKSIWQLGYQCFDKKNVIKFKNYANHWLRFCIDKNKQLQLHSNQLSNNKMFKELFQLFVNTNDMNRLIKSIRFPYGIEVNFYVESEKESDVSFPTPQMIKSMLNHKQRRNSILHHRGCFTSMLVPKLQKTWHTLNEFVKDIFESDEELIRKQYSPRLTYAVCNVWEDICYQNEYKYYSQSNDNNVFVKYDIPNEIIYLILDYKNSIVMIDNEQEQDVLIDTYGKAFDYYPKILSWSVEERNAHIDYILNINEPVAHCWMKYFEKKKRFKYFHDSATIASDKVKSKVNNIIYDVVSSNHH